MFLEALLYRRYEAKLRFELDFWSRFDGDGGDVRRATRSVLTAATGVRYRRDNYLADMDAGFYSADYLRAWIRSAQLRRISSRGRRRLVARARRPASCCGRSSVEGTKPTSEEIAGRLGFDPLDTTPLLHELGV